MKVRKIALVAPGDCEAAISRLVEILTHAQADPTLRITAVLTTEGSPMFSGFKVPVHLIKTRELFPLVGKTGGWIWRPLAVYDYFRENEFDQIHFLDPTNDAFIAVQAKRVGMGLSRTFLSTEIGKTRPQFRASSGKQTEDPYTELKKDYFEHYVIENSDSVLLLEDQKWMNQNGWNLSGATYLTHDLKIFNQTIRPTPPAKTPSVTVCVAYFNHGHFLPQVLKSLETNSYSNYSVIVVDDGSTDPSSIEVFERLSQQYPSWKFLKKKNGGPGQTRNFAASHADTDLLIFLDADNIATPKMIEHFAHCMSLSGKDCLSAGFLAFSGDAYPSPQTPIKYGYQPIGPCIDVGVVENIFGDTTFCIKREVFQKLGGFLEEKGLFLEDWEFLSRLSLSGYHLDSIPKPLFFYRHLKGSWGRAPDRTKSESKILENYRLLNKKKLAPVFFNTIPQPKSKIGRGLFFASDFARALARKLKRVPISSIVKEPYSKGRFETLRNISSKNQLKNVQLCLHHQDLDFIALSHNLREPPQIGIPENSLFFRRELADAFQLKTPLAKVFHGRILRLLPGDETFADLGETLRLWSPKIDGPKITVGIGPSSIPAIFPFNTESPLFIPSHSSQKPVIFVLPAYLAMGGVERNTVEIIRKLRDRYDFVVISVERLNEKQGSLASQFMEVSDSVYELGELARPEVFIDMLKSLKAVYRPSLVWICNGSPWQADHAQDIRDLFSEIPIIDQQAYDTKRGWITRFGEKGIRASDRFIAITKRIQDVFLNQLKIDPIKIDLIYPALDSDRFKPRIYSLEDRKALLAKYKIPSDGPIYAMIGRLTGQKKPLDFLQLALLAQKAGRKDHFLLIGDGEMANKVADFIKRKKLKNVSRINSSDTLFEIYPLLSGLVILSQYEGLPIVMLEALCCGIPILSTDVGDIRSILEEYGSGMILPKVGEAHSIFEGWKKWSTDIERYRSLALNAAPLVREKFSSQNIASQYEACWKKAVTEFKYER